VNELGGPTASIGLEQQDRGYVISVVFDRIDIFIPSLVLDQEEKQVVRSGHGLGFGRCIQFDLTLSVPLMYFTWTISVLYKNGDRRGDIP
jgi:hypothetical protein